LSISEHKAGKRRPSSIFYCEKVNVKPKTQLKKPQYLWCIINTREKKKQHTIKKCTTKNQLHWDQIRRKTHQNICSP